MKIVLLQLANCMYSIVATDDVLSLMDDEVRLAIISVTLRSRFSTAFPHWGMT